MLVKYKKNLLSIMKQKKFVVFFMNLDCFLTNDFLVKNFLKKIFFS